MLYIFCNSVQLLSYLLANGWLPLFMRRRQSNRRFPYLQSQREKKKKRVSQRVAHDASSHVMIGQVQYE